MIPNRKLCIKCGQTKHIRFFDLNENNEVSEICSRCAKKEATFVCTKCKCELPLSEFSKSEHNDNHRYSICKSCRRPLQKLVRQMLKVKKVVCKFTTLDCSYSSLYGLCCRECPMYEWCTDRCENKPLAEPKGCGCVAETKIQ